MSASASSGMSGRTRSTAEWNSSLRSSPPSVGTSTKRMVDSNSCQPLMGTNWPASSEDSAGVMTAVGGWVEGVSWGGQLAGAGVDGLASGHFASPAAIVEKVVIRTESATSAGV